MKNGLLEAVKNNINKFSLSEREMQSLDWEDESEFCYRGEMYDVVKMEKQNGQNIIWCISDKKETALLEQYLKVQKQSSPKNSSSTILKLLTVQYIPVTESYLVAPFQTKQQAFAEYLCYLPSSVLAIHTPPPKVRCVAV